MFNCSSSTTSSWSSSTHSIHCIVNNSKLSFIFYIFIFLYFYILCSFVHHQQHHHHHHQHILFIALLTILNYLLSFMFNCSSSGYFAGYFEIYYITIDESRTCDLRGVSHFIYVISTCFFHHCSAICESSNHFLIVLIVQLFCTFKYAPKGREV